MNIKEKLIEIKNKVIAFYTAKTTASYIALIITALIGITVVAIGSISIISAITKDSGDKNRTATASTILSSTAEETTTSPLTSAEATTEEASSAEATTEETTTEIPSTEEATTKQTTKEPVSQPPTIGIKDLNIGSAEEEATAETKNNNRFNSDFYEDNSSKETEKPSSQTSTSNKNENNGSTSDLDPAGPTINENATIIKGIDVSKWNPNIDWTKVKDSGVDYVIIRAGYRGQQNPKLYEDPYFKQHIEGATSVGLKVGVYFYSQAITEDEALEEASFLLSIIQDYNLTYPVCFDWEPEEGTRAKDANLTKSQASAVARKFLSTMEGYGYDTMLYSYHSAIKTYFNSDLLKDYKVWVAYYFNAYKDNGVEFAPGDNVPDTEYPFQMWQYSSTASVSGITGDVDINVSFFSYNSKGKATSTSVINVPTTSYTIKPGESIDYKTGVTAYDSAGTNITTSVVISITDSNGNAVSEETAFNTIGSYTIKYAIKDFTGISKKVKATVTVRDNPTLTLAKDTLTFNRYNTSYKDIVNAIKDNITSVTDCEGNTIAKKKVELTGLDDFYSKENDIPAETTTPDSSSEETTTKANDQETTGTVENTETTETNTDASKTPMATDSTPSQDTSATSKDSETTSSTKPSKYINGLILGSFEITYTVSDSTGATTTATITLILTDEDIESE